MIFRNNTIVDDSLRRSYAMQIIIKQILSTERKGWWTPWGLRPDSDQCRVIRFRVCSANRLDIKYIVLLSSNRLVLL